MAAAEKKRIKSGRTTFSDDDDEVDEGGFREHAAPALTISQHLMDFFAARCKMLVPVVLFIFLLMLLVWDMKTTSILSDIIHDDHTNLWEKMDATMLAKWLSPLDLCMLKIDQKNMSIKAFRQKNCSKLHDRSSGESAPRLFCSIGSSLGKPCTAPLSTRSFFTSRLLGPLGDADNFALKTSLRRLALQKKALVFIGDAISKQNQEATLCELLRTDQISITGGGGHHDSNSTISEFGISWIDQPSLSMDVIFMHIAHLDIAHHHKGRRKLSDGSNFDTDIDGIHRRNDHRKLDLLIDEHHKLNATNYAQNEPSLTLLSASAHMENFSHQYPGGMMIVANIGVWYNSREKFRKDLPVFLRWLEDLGVENTVLFRETAAQHWNHTGIFSSPFFIFLL